ncbi:DUF4236 domain-containing protein [Amycolatopsis suaedae]|uniref:DUF4236 domain-containing protein n=1 Tax=Amycolatopsis suaedae TaxID=2510978 RepID=A0A4Q7JG00_9PSEU|nr:DUF4236 domain-containing protein [Amycolatopsis suaedae]RZQ65893.1 DUF4236 domain-containing protein [Amycolatopsis suaedae]
MSFYLRTSIKVGPVRLNMSTSGLGASVGIPGFRFGARPCGSYVSLGGGAASYRATARPRSGPVQQSSRGAPRARSISGRSSPDDVVLSNVSGATTIEMSEVGSSELVSQLNDAARSPKFWPWCLAATIALMTLSPWLLFAGAPLTMWIFWKDRIRRTVVAFYDVQGTEATRFQQLVDSFDHVRAAQRAWHIVAAGAVATTHQHKVNAGASALVRRLPVNRSLSGPKHLASNIAVPSLDTPHRSVYLLPDRVLIRDGRHYADIDYENVRVQAGVQRFIEDSAVPSDSEVVDHTWQYVNVRGGPDRRFKNNRQLPIVQYGRLMLTGSGGYSAIFDVSNPRASSVLETALATMTTPAGPTSLVPPQVHPWTDAPPARSIDLDRPPDLAARSIGLVNPVEVGPAGTSLTCRRLSAQGRVAVVGESHYQAALCRAARGTPAGTDLAQHLRVVAALVPEPDNPHDPNAVRVVVVTGGHGETVGHLPRGIARAYQRPLLALRTQGSIGTCPGRITGGGIGRYYGIYLHLAEPESLLLENLVGDIDLVEPARRLTVTREEDHQDTLSHYQRIDSSRTLLVAELVSSTVSRGKHKGAYAIEVRLNGKRVGELTAKMSSRYQSLVVNAEAMDSQPICEAELTHGDYGYQVDIYLPSGQ